MSNVGERLAALSASFEAEKQYQHDRWHKLANDLQPLVNLPVQMARDIGKIQGTFDGRISTVTKEIERSITAAVERAIEPLSDEVTKLRSEVDTLKAGQQQLGGARMFGVWLVQTLVAAGAALGVGKLLFGGP